MQTKTILAALSVAAYTTLTALAFAPTAAAHTCDAINPATSCGDCLSGTHAHYFNVHGHRILYCSSFDGEHEPCFIAPDDLC
ncbi:MAG: hypothetical protein QOI63_1907 [Thermoplasmata archaeon]|jgi:hypothetical protein|nr:hypothetical protein [Thermoplasmata archaeon]